jgi:ribose transport system ATP-binding protein
MASLRVSAARRAARRRFRLQRGEVHALFGENGAGKSTLINVLSGVIAPDNGEILIDGAAVRYADPRAAQAAGVATIFQELDLVPSLDVSADLFLGRELTRAGVLDRSAMHRVAWSQLDAIGSMSISIGRSASSRSAGDRSSPSPRP